MGFIEALLYGAVQGLTEYLPVSSSAHLLMLPRFLNQTDPGLAFDVFLHIGTLLATGIYFFKEWLVILRNPFSFQRPSQGTNSNGVTLIHLFIGTLPAVIAGLVLNHWIKENTREIWILWVTLPVFGLLLWWADHRGQKLKKSLATISYADFLWIGCAQMLALIPGVSRSGSTITAGRWLGFSRSDSARISFLLSMPVTLGAIVLELRHFEEIRASVQGWLPLIVAAVSSLLFGALAIRLMLTWVSRTSYSIFAVYRVIIAAVLAALFA